MSKFQVAYNITKSKKTFASGIFIYFKILYYCILKNQHYICFRQTLLCTYLYVYIYIVCIIYVCV